MINNYHFKLIHEKTYSIHCNHSHRTGGRDDLSAKGCTHGCIDETCQRGAGHGTVQACQDGSRNGIRHVGFCDRFGHRGNGHRPETDGGQLFCVQHRKSCL